jgi:hypothetical protein
MPGQSRARKSSAKARAIRKIAGTLAEVTARTMVKQDAPSHEIGSIWRLRLAARAEGPVTYLAHEPRVANSLPFLGVVTCYGRPQDTKMLRI